MYRIVAESIINGDAWYWTDGGDVSHNHRDALHTTDYLHANALMRGEVKSTLRKSSLWTYLEEGTWDGKKYIWHRCTPLDSRFTRHIDALEVM